jgi:hypothetical protein
MGWVGSQQQLGERPEGEAAAEGVERLAYPDQGYAALTQEGKVGTPPEWHRAYLRLFKCSYFVTA